MDVSAKKLALLKSFLDLSTSASRPDLSALVKTNGAFFSDSLFDEDSAVASAAAALLAALAAQPRYRPALLAHGTASCLVRARGERRGGAVCGGAAPRGAGVAARRAHLASRRSTPRSPFFLAQEDALCDFEPGAARDAAATALRLLREPAAAPASAAAPAPQPPKKVRRVARIV